MTWIAPNYGVYGWAIYPAVYLVPQLFRKQTAASIISTTHSFFMKSIHFVIFRYFYCISRSQPAVYSAQLGLFLQRRNPFHRRRVGWGGCPPQPLYRSGRVQLGHPAPQQLSFATSLRVLARPARRGAGSAGGAVRTAPRSSRGVVSGG